MSASTAGAPTLPDRPSQSHSPPQPYLLTRALALPPALQAIAQRALDLIQARTIAEGERMRSAFDFACADAALRERLLFVLAGSPFVADWALRAQSADLEALLGGAFSRVPARAEWAHELRGLLDPIRLGDDPQDRELKRELRVWRLRCQVGVVWRDLLGENDFESTTAQLSDMAESAIDATLRCCTAREIALRGWPAGDRNDVPQQLVVLAMGKLGARELNLSSDVDLIFAYPSAGETTGGTARAVTHQAFFVRIAQRLIAALDEQTGEGFVFRVDMRLRPFGASGALVSSFDALEDYYQEQGRNWERYALIKARPITGDAESGAALVARLNPFIYRRYLDFGAIEALREMKELINRERRAPEFVDDVKLGAGGIREVEFTAQVFQLIFGGRDTRLQQRRLRAVLATLAEEQWLGSEVVHALDTAYVFLRHVEHRLQAVRDAQTQRLPSDELERLRIAVAMGFADWSEFIGALDAHRSVVQAEFERLVAREEPLARFTACWPDISAGADAQLRELGFAAELALPALRRLAEARARLTHQDEARRRLDLFVPKLLAAAGAVASDTAPATRALLSGLNIAEAVLRRSAYLALLNENPGALGQLVQLCAASDAIAARLSARPALLDELLDTRSLLTIPDRAQISAWLHAQLARVPADDLEQQMDALRSFKEGHVLRVAVCEVTGVLPLMKVSDSLTWCAEAVLEASLDLAWRMTVAQYGRPSGGHDFLIVGYGKLGGLELGPGSDLDLLFLHDAPMTGSTDGERPVANPTFYARLSQRLMHILTTATQRGTLYDIDTRLRPSGRAGMMVTSIAGFESYQREEAWTYEHQALVRARPICGARMLAERFEDVRRRILVLRRDPTQLRDEVLAMRERMQSVVGQLGPETASELKRGRGGIVDIEFIVQYLVLAHAAEHPALLRYTDNVRILESVTNAGLLDATDANGLTAAYLALRAAAHAHALGAVVPSSDELAVWRAGVRDIWETVFSVATN